MGKISTFNIEFFLMRNFESGVFFIPDTPIEQLTSSLAERDIDLMYLPGVNISTTQDFLSSLRGAFRCPYRCLSWDSALDCLRDLVWLSAASKVLMFDNVQTLAQNEYQSFRIAVTMLADAADFWKRKKADQPFYVFLSGARELVSEIKIFAPDIIAL